MGTIKAIDTKTGMIVYADNAVIGNRYNCIFCGKEMYVNVSSLNKKYFSCLRGSHSNAICARIDKMGIMRDERVTDFEFMLHRLIAEPKHTGESGRNSNAGTDDDEISDLKGTIDINNEMTAVAANIENSSENNPSVAENAYNSAISGNINGNTTIDEGNIISNGSIFNNCGINCADGKGEPSTAPFTSLRQIVQCDLLGMHGHSNLDIDINNYFTTYRNIKSSKINEQIINHVVGVQLISFAEVSQTVTAKMFWRDYGAAEYQQVIFKLYFDNPNLFTQFCKKNFKLIFINGKTVFSPIDDKRLYLIACTWDAMSTTNCRSYCDYAKCKGCRGLYQGPVYRKGQIEAYI